MCAPHDTIPVWAIPLASRVLPRPSQPTTVTSRHSALVRVTHWITTLCFFALLVSGIEIVISHPRFYWGETGNVLTTPLFKLPIPASRASGADRLRLRAAGPERLEPVSPLSSCLGRGIDRLTVFNLRLVHRAFAEKLAPGRADLSWRAFSSAIANHLRFKRPSEAEAWSYNVLQRLTYLFVIFVLFPLVIWTGLAMSPAFVSAFPATVTVLGGQQSARTLHFFVSLALVLFLLVHVVMVCLAGFRSRMRAMITGRAATHNGAHMSEPPHHLAANCHAAN